jgi:hypothetical protein
VGQLRGLSNSVMYLKGLLTHYYRKVCPFPYPITGRVCPLFPYLIIRVCSIFPFLIITVLIPFAVHYSESVHYSLILFHYSPYPIASIILYSLLQEESVHYSLISLFSYSITVPIPYAEESVHYSLFLVAGRVCPRFPCHCHL